MIADIIYKVCKLEKRVKQLENEKTVTLREDGGTLLQGHSYCTSCNVFCSGGKKAMLIMASAEIQVYAETQNNSYNARGVLCIPLSKGENKVEIVCLAVASDVHCILTAKIIDLG